MGAKRKSGEGAGGSASKTLKITDDTAQLEHAKLFQKWLFFGLDWLLSEILFSASR